jgi:TP901-1 family phage major tail protein
MTEPSLGVAKRAAAAAAPTNETSNLAIVALATSSSLEATNSVNETAARNGTGGSTNYIASGAMSWSTSIDGLLDVASAAGNGVDVMDAARNRYYMVVKFNIDEGSSDTFYAGQALIDSVSISGGVDDIATYSASFSGYGDLYKG